MQSRPCERRRFTRYAIPVPVRCRSDGDGFETRAGDLSGGGVSFLAGHRLPPGQEVEVALPLERDSFRMRGEVVRCEPDPEAGDYRVGVRFSNDEHRFRAKLGEQVARIHQLRRELSRLRGVEVSVDEAATEWVRHYAAGFDDEFDS